MVARWVPRHQNGTADALASRAVGLPQAPVGDGGAVVPWPAREPLDDPALPPLAEPVAGAVARLRARAASEAPPRFRDFLALRTGGLDGYSRLAGERLEEAVRQRWSGAGLAWLQAALEGAGASDYARSALRWVARGLPPPLALKKASVDLEVAARGAGRPGRASRVADVRAARRGG